MVEKRQNDVDKKNRRSPPEMLQLAALEEWHTYEQKNEKKMVKKIEEQFVDEIESNLEAECN